MFKEKFKTIRRFHVRLRKAFIMSGKVPGRQNKKIRWIPFWISAIRE